MRAAFTSRDDRMRGWRLPGATLLLAAAALAAHLLPGADRLLEYRRELLGAGQLWRLVSGHWTHFSPGHLTWDLLVFLLLGSACERRDRRRLLITLAAAVPAVSLVVWCLLSGMVAYRGLSGLDSALFGLLAALVARDALRERSKRGLAVVGAFLLLFAGKTAYELVRGAGVFVTDYGAAVAPVPLAHLAGAVTGLAVGLARRPGARCYNGRRCGTDDPQRGSGDERRHRQRDLLPAAVGRGLHRRTRPGLHLLPLPARSAGPHLRRAPRRDRQQRNHPAPAT